MKKLCTLTLLLIGVLSGYANYNGTVYTNQNELVFSTSENYDIVSITNGFFTEEIGAPQLPVKILSFLIPVDKKVSEVIINSTNIQQLSGYYNIFPVQTPVSTNLSQNAMIFDDPDSLIYNSNDPYPGNLYEVYDDGYPMGYHVITIKFFPVEYLPESGILNLYTDISFTIVYENNDENILLPILQTQYSYNLSQNYIKNIVENPEDLSIVTGGAKEVVTNNAGISNLKGMSPSNLTHIPDYIIITSGSEDLDLLNSFQALADWKIQKGIYTIVVDIQDIYDNYQGYDNAERIRNYLKDVYVNFGSKYILLGGDVDIVPTRFTPIHTSDNYETNYYYATVQRDWNANGNNVFGEYYDQTDYNPVFYVGRAPVKNVSEADNFVNKVIEYERFNNPYLTNKDYINNLSFWVGNDGGSGPFNRLNSIDNSVTGYIDPTSIFVLKLYDPYLGSIIYGEAQFHDRYDYLSHDHVLNSLNTGWDQFQLPYGNIHLFYHCDHSKADIMGTSSCYLHKHIIKSDMSNLSNGINYSQILYSDGCEPNQFSLNDAISEHYINNPDGGGVAFIGNSDAGYWSDITNDNFFDAFCQSIYDMQISIL